MRFHVFRQPSGMELALDLERITTVLGNDGQTSVIVAGAETYHVKMPITDVVALLQPTPSAADEYGRELAEACALNRTDRTTEQTAAGTNIEARIIAARLDELRRLEECSQAWNWTLVPAWLREYLESRPSFIEQGKDGPCWQQLGWSRKIQNAIAEGEA